MPECASISPAAVHDVHGLEALGVPSVAIATTAFARQAIFQAEALGCSEPEKRIVLAEHPISNCNALEIARKASELYVDLVRQLTSNKPTSALRKRRLRSEEPSAACLLGA